MKTTEDFARYCLEVSYIYSSQFVHILLKIRQTSFEPILYLPGYLASYMAYLAADMIVKGCY